LRTEQGDVFRTVGESGVGGAAESMGNEGGESAASPKSTTSDSPSDESSEDSSAFTSLTTVITAYLLSQFTLYIEGVSKLYET
jgi:hypothetical protein